MRSAKGDSRGWRRLSDFFFGSDPSVLRAFLASALLVSLIGINLFLYVAGVTLDDLKEVLLRLHELIRALKEGL